MRRRVGSAAPFEAQIGYSRAVRDGRHVFVSGTTGFDYATMTIDPDPAVQADRALSNIAAALADAGAGFEDIVPVRYILPDPADFEPCWPVLRRWFGDIRPAATMFAADLMDPRMKIEIEATALATMG